MSEGAGGLRRLFRRLELPVDIATRPTQSILLRAMAALFADAAVLVGDPMLGFTVGVAMSATDFSPWAAYAMAADSLEGCLRRAARARSRLSPPPHAIVSCGGPESGRASAGST